MTLFDCLHDPVSKFNILSFGGEGDNVGGRFVLVDISPSFAVRTPQITAIHFLVVWPVDTQLCLARFILLRGDLTSACLSLP